MIQEKKISKRTTKLLYQSFDLIVIDGGLSGVCCAIAAARKGVRVALSHMGNKNRWARRRTY